MLEIAHVKGNHSTLIILHVYPLCKWLQGALRLFMPGFDKSKAADDCNEKSSGAESLMVQGARRSLNFSLRQFILLFRKGESRRGKIFNVC